MTELTVEHFLQVHEMLASYYGTQSPTLPGVALAFKTLKQRCPHLTAEQFDWAVSEALMRCRFHPRLSDFMESLFERDLSELPALPDIDPRYADSYQQSIYYRAVSDRNKAAASCPYSTTMFKHDRLGQIPGTTQLSKHAIAPSVEEWNRAGALDSGGSGQPVAALQGEPAADVGDVPWWEEDA